MTISADRIFETCLYASDIPAEARFYSDVIGLPIIGQSGTRAVVFRCGSNALLIFNPAETSVDDGRIPSHGATGPGHVAFLSAEEDLPEWRAKLKRSGVTIEREVDWDQGGTSLYVRDPGGNSVELAPPTLWRGLGFLGQSGPR